MSDHDFCRLLYGETCREAGLSQRDVTVNGRVPSVRGLTWFWLDAPWGTNLEVGPHCCAYAAKHALIVRDCDEAEEATEIISLADSKGVNAR